MRPEALFDVFFKHVTQESLEDAEREVVHEAIRTVQSADGVDP
jgi:hypothetical protein